MKIKIIKTQMAKSELANLAKETYGEMIKAVADLDSGWIAVGGELHADAEMMLLNEGSLEENLWGFNIYPAKQKEDRIEFTSLINVRPKHGNPSIVIEKEDVRSAIRQLVDERVDWNKENSGP